jgi:hypothetical protein
MASQLTASLTFNTLGGGSGTGSMSEKSISRLSSPDGIVTASGQPSFTGTSNGKSLSQRYSIVPVSTSIMSGVAIASGGSMLGSSSAPQYTVSTVYTTVEYTITSCHSTITNCPIGHVTTDTISLYTTICPATPNPIAASTTELSPESVSTIFTTVVYTITSCHPTVTNCPVGHLTTDTIPVYTTVCPAKSTPEPTEAPYVIGILVTVIIDITVEIVVNEISGLTGS